MQMSHDIYSQAVVCNYSEACIMYTTIGRLDTCGHWTRWYVHQVTLMYVHTLLHFKAQCDLACHVQTILRAGRWNVHQDCQQRHYAYGMAWQLQH